MYECRWSYKSCPWDGMNEVSDTFPFLSRQPYYSGFRLCQHQQYPLFFCERAYMVAVPFEKLNLTNIQFNSFTHYSKLSLLEDLERRTNICTFALVIS